MAIAIPLHELGLSGLTAALMRDDEAGVAKAAQSYGRVLRRSVRAALDHQSPMIEAVSDSPLVATAEAVVFAADHPRRREYWVGAPTMATLIANKLALGVLDSYLASTAYQSQQTDLPYDSDQAANLWDPADGHQGHDYGTHGAFDNRSSTRSYQATLARHRGLLGTLTSAAAAALLITRRRRHGASRCP